MIKRVVITGVGGLTAFGDHWDTIFSRLKAYQNAVQYMPEWEQYRGLNTKLAAPLEHFELPSHYSRKKIRAMGPVSLLATRATELALQNAGLLEDPILTSGAVGIAYGSSVGSTEQIADFGRMLINKDVYSINATTYVKMMGHTAAVNTGLFFGLRGRVIPTSTACTSGSQSIGYAYEAIKHGYQTIMVAGGAEELCPSEAAVFDTLFATSQKNDTPKKTPTPFDRDRDGLVIGEGACSVILEELDHARARGAKILGEIVGFASNCDASHITQPRKETMQVCMEMALANAGLSPSEIGYICAHGTATKNGDIAESLATESIYGASTPISSLKSYFGHTLGACGAIELWLSLEMMKHHWFAPTINLVNVDEACGALDYIKSEGRILDIEYIQSNNFAFGGINTSLVLKRWN